MTKTPRDKRREELIELRSKITNLSKKLESADSNNENLSAHLKELEELLESPYWRDSEDAIIRPYLKSPPKTIIVRVLKER